MLLRGGAQELSSSALAVTTTVSLKSNHTFTSPMRTAISSSFRVIRSLALSFPHSHRRFIRNIFVFEPSPLTVSSHIKNTRLSPFLGAPRPTASVAAFTASVEHLSREDERVGVEENWNFNEESGNEFSDFDASAAANDLKHLPSPFFEVKELEELPEQWRRSKLAWLCKQLPAHKHATSIRILNAQRKWITQEDATYIAVHCTRIRENETAFRVYKWMTKQHWFRFDFALATKIADYLGKERKFSKCREIFDDIINQGIMDIPANELFGCMKKGKKKRATKRARVEHPPAAVPEPEQPTADQPPIIDLVKEDSGKPSPPCVPEEAMSSEPIPTAAASLGSDDTVRSILSPKFGLLKSKGEVFVEEVASWAELPVAQLGARAATHCMM